MIRSGLILAVLVLGTGAAQAHDGKVHASDTEAAAHAALPAATGVPLPFDLGGAFTLTDQHGQTRTERDPDGHLQLLFFGYAQCREICSAALPQMAEVAAALKARGTPITPVLITVDPARDTVAAMAPAMAKWSADFVGLTGTETELAVAHKAFSIDSSLVFEDPASGPVYAHGSFIYLLDGAGQFITVLPPILSNDRMIDIIASHAAAQSG
jgi:protein SCO1